jgi:flagellin-like hook-associated protein FlgL
MQRVTAAISHLQTTGQTLQTQLGSVDNVDMASIITQLTAQQTAYQAAVAAGAQMKMPTLASYLT